MFRSAKNVVDFIPKGVEKEENEVEYYNCSYCSDGGWTSETEVDVHRAVTHTRELINLIETNKNTCKICVTPFNCMTDLHKHIYVDHLYSAEDAHRVEREIFICDICNEVFFNKLLLDIHIRHIHSRFKCKKTYVCPKCNKLLKTDNVWFHFQSHNIQSVSICKICLKKCGSRRSLQEHVKTHPKYLNCNMCSYDTRREDLFKQHILTKHKNTAANKNGNVKRFFIPTVEYPWKFPKITGLRGLQLTNNLRICVLCREICKNKQNMIDHILSEHTISEVKTKQEHKCSCGEIFSNMVLLKHHIFKLKGDHQSI